MIQTLPVNKKLESSTDFACHIWDFVYELYMQDNPVSINIYHQFDGMIFIECKNVIFTTLRFRSFDKSLLQNVAKFAEKSNVKGKMYLNSTKSYNKLHIKFYYSK